MSQEIEIVEDLPKRRYSITLGYVELHQLRQVLGYATKKSTPLVYSLAERVTAMLDDTDRIHGEWRKCP